MKVDKYHLIASVFMYILLFAFLGGGLFLFNSVAGEVPSEKYSSFDINEGLHKQYYYAELFDPIYYSNGFEYKYFSYPEIPEKYSECSVFNRILGKGLWKYLF